MKVESDKEIVKHTGVKGCTCQVEDSWTAVSLPTRDDGAGVMDANE